MENLRRIRRTRSGNSVRLKVGLGILGLLFCLANVGSSIKASSPPQRAFQHIDMLSITQGWAWSRSRIWVTTDGGVQWHTVTPTFKQAINVKGLVSLTPLSSRSAVVTWELASRGGSTAVGVTTNRGQHWQETGHVPSFLSPWGLSGNATDLQWTSITRGWAMQLGIGNASGNESYWLWTTGNSGKTWVRMHTWNPGLPWAWLTFSSTQAGWMAADPGPLPMSQLYHTTNRGRSWKAVSWRLPKRTLEFSELSPALPIRTSNGEILAVLNRNTGRIMVLQLGQNPHWISQGWKSSPPSFRTGFASTVMTFARIQDGWLVTRHHNTLWATTNGGQSWQVINRNSQWRNLLDLDFISAQTGWALTTAPARMTVLWHTVNGGRTWSILF